MTAYTDITIGRLTLRETFDMSSNVSAGTDTQTIVLSGEESFPPLTLVQVKQRREDILGLQNRLVPIRFGTKSDHDGWYRITDVNTAVRDYQGEVRAFTWGINAAFIGPANAVDLESRITGVQRINDFGLTGEKWHAVPVGFTSYYANTTTAMSRATTDGASARVWRSVGASAHPRWTVPLATYDIGRCRVLQDGVERVGTNVLNTDAQQDNWVLTNGVVSASMGSGNTFNIAAWDGAQWDSKGWNLGLGSSTFAQPGFAYATILRNDYEVSTIRIVDDSTAGILSTIDLTVRRGSRFIEGRIARTSSGTLAVWPSTAEAGTSPASSGYVRATSNDAGGNRYVCGSARSFTAMTASGGLSASAATSFDFFIGAEVGGSAAQSGDDAATLVSHYLTAMAEVTLASVR